MTHNDMYHMQVKKDLLAAKYLAFLKLKWWQFRAKKRLSIECQNLEDEIKSITKENNHA